MSQLERVEAQLAFNEGRALYSQMSLSLYEEAIPNFTKAIQLYSDYALAYFNRGVSYSNLGEYQNAIDDYTKAIKLDPDDALAYSNRAAALWELGQ